MSVSFQDQNLTMEEIFNQDPHYQTSSSYNKGERIKGKVTGYRTDDSIKNIILNIGSKFEGCIPAQEFNELPEVGSEIEGIVKDFNQEKGLYLVSHKELIVAIGFALIKESVDNDMPLFCKIKRKIAKGFIVEVESVEMFMPFSHVGTSLSDENSDKKQGFIGSIVQCKCLQLPTKMQKGVVSRKVIQDQKNKDNWKKLAELKQVGDIVEGTVLKTASSGFYVLVNDVIGYLHNSNVRWSRVKSKDRENLVSGSIVSVRILELDEENMRLSLGLKQLVNDPWENILSTYSIGDVVTGTVSYVARQVAFIDLTDDIEGIIYSSEMSWTKNSSLAKDFLKKDAEVTLKIISINIKERKILLGLKQLQENPWDRLQAEIKVGDIYKGKIKNITLFGIFVELNDSLDGMIHKDDISWEGSIHNLADKYHKNQEIEFKVIQINPEQKKIVCSIKHCFPNPYEELKKKYVGNALVNGIVTSIVEYGVFVKLDGQYEGLLHISEVPKGKFDTMKSELKKGDSIQVLVKSVDPEKMRIALSLKGFNYAVEKQEMVQYISKDSDTSVNNLFKDLSKFVVK